MTKVLTFGVFDYFHLGHLRLFNQCREYGDYLIVAVQEEESIKKFKPDAKILYSTQERVEILESIKVVDKVITYNEVCVEEIAKIDFDVIALGEDHVGERFAKIEQWCQEHNKKVAHLKRTPSICSSQIKETLTK